jgi:hypothetical protein
MKSSYSRLLPGSKSRARQHGVDPSTILTALLVGILVMSFPPLIGIGLAIALLLCLWSGAFSVSGNAFNLSRLSQWKGLGIVLGTLLFAGIVTHADPAMAQLFGDAESQANGIFGQYIDQNIITFLFGLLRIVVWVSAVGFIFFAVYQAQRGEQWQPLVQNAFIIIAAVVVVEGLSALFFG